MSCDHCPHCKAEQADTPFSKSKGGLSLISGSGSLEEKTTDPESKTPFSAGKPVRGKAREYSTEFEFCWRRYPRKEQKFEAFAVWNLRVRELGSPQNLMTLIFSALDWQLPQWAGDDFKYVPYFERYLKRRKWEDEPPHQAPRQMSREEREQTEREASRLFGGRR